MSKQRNGACTDPSHHVDGATALVREIERACIERRLRLTPLRKDVLRLVVESDRPIKAYDLLHAIRASNAVTAPPTAYRALHFLVDQGFIHKLESVNAYMRCHHPRVPHAVPFLICDTCECAMEMEDDRTASLIEEKAAALGFAPRTQTLEVHGICRDCAAAHVGANNMR